MRKLGIYTGKSCYLVIYSASRKDRNKNSSTEKCDLETTNCTVLKYLAFRAKQVLKTSYPHKLRSVTLEGKDRIFILRYIKGANPCRGEANAHLGLVPGQMWRSPWSQVTLDWAVTNFQMSSCAHQDSSVLRMTSKALA